MSARQVLHSSNSSDWFTPPYILNKAGAVLGGIDLDPASNPVANQLVQATEIFTEAEDGLSRTWLNNWFCNPPYGPRITDKWVSHAVAQAPHSSGILLLNATTDRKWFQQLWQFPICFLYRRIRFYETYEQWRDTFVKGWIKKNGFSPGEADIPTPTHTLFDGSIVLGRQPTHGNVLVYVSNRPNVGRFDMEMGDIGHIVLPRE